MDIIKQDLKAAAIVGVVLVVPLAFLQASNTDGASALDASVLFGLLWLLGALFVMLLTTVGRNMRRIRSRSSSLYFFAALVSLMMVGVAWAGIVFDQMPCFMGVPNCD